MAKPENTYTSNGNTEVKEATEEPVTELSVTTADPNDALRVQGFEIVSSAPDPLFGDEPAVMVRVLPKGDGKIATGKFDRFLNKFTYHKRGDRIALHPSIAQAQEDNGHVEIMTDAD